MLPNQPDIKSLDFFYLSYHLAWTDFDSGAVTTLSQCCTNTGTYGNMTSKLISDGDSPNIWSQIDKMGKVFYSAILTDLGQNFSSIIPDDNIFTSPSLLSEFSKPIPGWIGPREAIRGAIETYWLTGGPARDTYDALRSVTGPLNVSSSVIYTQYFCQVPQVKSTGSLIVAILLANLVFLSALWKIFNWLVLHSLQRQDPTTMFCAGCMLQHRQQQLDTQQSHGYGYDPVVPPPSNPRLRSVFSRAKTTNTNTNTSLRNPYTPNHASTPSSPPASTIGIDIGSFGNHLGPAGSKATATSRVTSVELLNRRPIPAPVTTRTSLPRSVSTSYPDPFDDANTLDLGSIPAWAATPAPQPAQPAPTTAAAEAASQTGLGASNGPLHWDGTGWARAPSQPPAQPQFQSQAQILSQIQSQPQPTSGVSTLSTLAAARSVGRRPQGGGGGPGEPGAAAGGEDSVSMYSEASLPLLPR